MTPGEFWQRGLGLWLGVFIGSVLSFWWAGFSVLPLVIGAYCYDQSRENKNAKTIWFPVIIPNLVVCIALLFDWNLALLNLMSMTMSAWVLYHALAPHHFEKVAR